MFIVFVYVYLYIVEYLALSNLFLIDLCLRFYVFIALKVVLLSLNKQLSK